VPVLVGHRAEEFSCEPRSSNDHISYPCAFDECSLVILEEIRAEDELGPSGGVLYTLDELDAKWECLKDRLRGLKGE
jgi:GPN-loop GTPase